MRHTAAAGIAELAAASLDIANRAQRTLIERADDAAHSMERSAVKVACRIMRDVPMPYAEAMRANAARSAR